MMMDFLYFPEDKAEYIPAFITLVIFMIGALAAMYLFYKKSKKEEKYFEEKYKDKMFINNDHQESSKSSKDDQ